MIIPPISYGRIAEAITFYDKLSYRYLNVPWVVSEESVNVTKPPEVRSFSIPIGHLVASGEQSFIEIRDDLCPGRRYQCVTPCFRDESVSEYQLSYFLKNELISVVWKDDDPADELEIMINHARSFFRLCYGIKESPVVVQTDIGYDINLRGIEVGSYGIREYKKFRWVYGTGLAEPRFSQVIALRDKETENDNI